MKLNETNKNDSNINNKLVFSKNNTNVNYKENQITNQKFIKNINDNNNITKVDPRLELTLKYLDITSTLEIFINNNISFNDLLLLSKKDLIELGFSLVQRNRIFNFAQEYKSYGVKFNISEIIEFFNKHDNLNIRLVTTNNNNKFNIRKNDAINENINLNLVNENNNNDKIFYNTSPKAKNYKSKENTDNIKIQSENKIFPKNDNSINNYNTKNKNYTQSKNNKQKNSNNNNNIYLNKETNYQDSINTNQINNNNILNSSKLIRQNSKLSKNSSNTKSSKSRVMTVSKFFGDGLGTGSVSIFQKYQNISDEIDNYFKKYNEYKEQKQNRMKKYEILGSFNKRKNYKPIYNNIVKDNKKEESFKQENISKNKEDEINRKLLELQKRKKELKDKLNLICEKENKKLMIIKYLEEEEK